jgi:hypothetical protein
LIYGQELQAQLKKLRQTCFITPGKKFIVFWFVVLHLEVTSNFNSDTSNKIRYVYYISAYLVLICRLVINVYMLSKL